MDVWRDLSEVEKREVVSDLLAAGKINVPDLHYLGMSTTELDKRMSTINWHSTIYDHIVLRHAQTPAQTLVASQVSKIASDLQKWRTFDQHYSVSSVLLQVKYWNGTPLQSEIEKISDKVFEYILSQGIPRKIVEQSGFEIKVRNNKNYNLEDVTAELLQRDFSDKTLDQIKGQVENDLPAFTVAQTSFVGMFQATATLEFKKDKYQKYCLNSFDVVVSPDKHNSTEIRQHIPIDIEEKISFRQAVNLAMGRAVGFEKYPDRELVETWLVPNARETYEDGSPVIQRLPDGVFNSKHTLSRYDILEFNTFESHLSFLSRIREGDLTFATMERNDGPYMNVYITANPLARSINVTMCERYVSKTITEGGSVIEPWYYRHTLSGPAFSNIVRITNSEQLDLQKQFEKLNEMNIKLSMPEKQFITSIRQGDELKLEQITNGYRQSCMVHFNPFLNDMEIKMIGSRQKIDLNQNPDQDLNKGLGI